MHETTQITYGEGTITAIMNSESLTEVSAPDVRFGNYNAALKACFSAKELEKIEAGANAEVTFDYVMRDTLEDKNEEKSFDRAIAKAEKNSGTLHKGVFFDVVATKSIDGDEPTLLESFYEDVEVQFEIPLYLVAEDRFYYVMTNEMGVCNLETDVDEEADTLSISTKGIGTSLMIFQTEEETLIDYDHSLHIQSHHLIIGGIVLLAVAWLVIDRTTKKS